MTEEKKQTEVEVEGVQVYARGQLSPKDLYELANCDLYQDEIAREAAQRQYGVLFYRDDKHAAGAIACTEFKGRAWYSQYYVSVEDGKIVQSTHVNYGCEVKWVKESGVNRVMDPLPEDAKAREFRSIADIERMDDERVERHAEGDVAEEGDAAGGAN